MTKTISLTQGQVAIVDDGAYEHLMQWKWFAHWSEESYSYYACRNTRIGEGKRNLVRMHREVMTLYEGDHPGMEVDHKDHNTLNNTRSNLRWVTHSENVKNRYGNRSDNTSGYTGVTYDKRTGRYQSRATVRGKYSHLGYFATPEEAHAERVKFIQTGEVHTNRRGVN
jgi:HNH endonuclease/AP2 domain